MVTQFVGMSSPRFYILYAPKIPSTIMPSLLLTRDPQQKQKLFLMSTRIIAHYFENAYIKFRQIDFQYVNAEFRFYGKETEDLKKSAEILAERMKTSSNSRMLQLTGRDAPSNRCRTRPSGFFKIRVIGSGRGKPAARHGRVHHGSVTKTIALFRVVLKTGKENENLRGHCRHVYLLSYPL